MQIFRTMAPVKPGRRTRRLLGDERGMALIMVVGTASVLAIITGVIAVQSISNLRQAGVERAFERSLHVADAGVDHMLFLIRQQRQADHTDLDTGEPTPPSFASVAAERQWVLDEADAAYAADPDRLVTTREGDWIAMRPEGVPLIYSVGYVPSYDAPRKIRVVRAEYDFAPYNPGTAILTDGNLTINGDPEVVGSVPNAHGNGDVELIGSVDVDGYVSSSGTCSGCEPPAVGDAANSGGGKARIEVPEIDPRANYSMSEYDLCPDNTVRAGPEYDAGGLDVLGILAVPNASSTPCQGSVLADGTTFRGWDMQGADWRYSGTGTDHGVYYVYLGSAQISGSPGSSAAPWEVTIFAEADGLECNLVGGDIDVSGGANMVAHNKAKGLGFIAGRDLNMGGNVNYEGVFAAHEQFDIHGTPTMNGAVIAENSCHTPGSLVGPGSEVSGSVSITYDGVSAPLGSNIRTTLWLEI